jgi:hypothetical protein
MYSEKKADPVTKDKYFSQRYEPHYHHLLDSHASQHQKLQHSAFQPHDNNILRNKNNSTIIDSHSLLTTSTPSTSILSLIQNNHIHNRKYFIIHRKQIAKKLFNEFNDRIFEGRLPPLDLVWSNAMTNAAGKYCSELVCFLYIFFREFSNLIEKRELNNECFKNSAL